MHQPLHLILFAVLLHIEATPMMGSCWWMGRVRCSNLAAGHAAYQYPVAWTGHVPAGRPQRHRVGEEHAHVLAQLGLHHQCRCADASNLAFPAGRQLQILPGCDALPCQSDPGVAVLLAEEVDCFCWKTICTLS